MGFIEWQVKCSQTRGSVQSNFLLLVGGLVIGLLGYYVTQISIQDEGAKISGVAEEPSVKRPNDRLTESELHSPEKRVQAVEKEKKLKIDVSLIPSGSFMMGCLEGDDDCSSSEKKSRKVTIAHSFYVMKTEVTQGLYTDIMGKNPSAFLKCGKTCPVENVSWYDAVNFANKLNERMGLEACYKIGYGEEPSVTLMGTKCLGWRLLTEAEWEYAARGGEKFKYSGSSSVDEVSWYELNSERSTRSVGKKKANGFGLYDMSGNVWEWVFDAKDSFDISRDAYSIDNQMDSASERTLRGGSWFNDASSVRVSRLAHDKPSLYGNFLGFRLGRTVQ